jgi:hypothetical protein
MSAVDQYDDSQPLGDKFGVYALSAWSIDFLKASDTSTGQLSSTHGGVGKIYITQDKVLTDQPGNIGLEFLEPLSSFLPGMPSGYEALFGLWFDSISIITDDLPSDIADPTFMVGIFAVSSGDPDVPATWVDSASISPVPEPATMVLFASGLVGLAGFRKKWHKS